MRAVIFDGAASCRDLADAVLAALVPTLEARGWSVRRFELAKLDIPDCKGDFGCWMATPGVCVQPGPHRALAGALVHSELAVWLTPVTFGGYSSALKKQIDHCIPLALPMMAVVAGETHHPPRYTRFPALLAIGLQQEPDDDEAAVFRRVVERNVINLHATRLAVRTIARGDLPALDASVPTWLDDVAASAPPPVTAPPLELAPEADLPAGAPARALLVVGSPRGPLSVSHALAEHLASLLRARGLLADVASIPGAAQRRGPLPDIVRRFDQADLVALVTPLYVDALPAPVTELLELVARARAAGGGHRGRLVAIVNCGFPEAVHADTALAIARAFARRTGFAWLGGLAFGGGGMLAGKPIAELGRRARFAVSAVELTASALASGGSVPDQAQRLARTLPIPRWLYRGIADASFVVAAAKHGVADHLADRPYAEV